MHNIEPVKCNGVLGIVCSINLFEWFGIKLYPSVL